MDDVQNHVEAAKAQEIRKLLAIHFQPLSPTQ